MRRIALYLSCVAKVGECVLGKTFKEWLNEGEQLYATAVSEYQAIEQKIAGLEKELAEKKSQVDEIAKVMGKAPVDTSRRVSAEIVDRDQLVGATAAIPVGAMARALTGRTAAVR